MEEKTNLPMAVVDSFDFDDEVSSSIIKGTKIKFTLDFQWVTRGGEVIKPDCELLVIEIIKVVQKWLPGQKGPAETIILMPDEKFPDIAARNAKAPRTDKVEKFNKLTGPWQGVQIVYLVDQQSMSVYTWVAPIETVGSSLAIKDLKESTRLARRLRGLNVFPVVSLCDTFMPTQYGGRQRPCLKIKNYQPLGPEQVVPAQIDAGDVKRIEARHTKTNVMDEIEETEDSEPDVGVRR
jgi:hypothetical protein